MKAEKVLTRKGVAIKLIPTPREFSSDCGIAIRFEFRERVVVESELEDATIEIAAVREMS
jgi:hypothetical protein